MALMDLAYDHLKHKGGHITALLERGLVLAMREEAKAPEDYTTARLLLCELGVDMQRACVSLAALNAFICNADRIRKLTLTEQTLANFALNVIEQVERWPDYDKARKILANPEWKPSKSKSKPKLP